MKASPISARSMWRDARRGETYVRTFTDRFAQADTRDTFHTYRLIIRGEDMAVEMDGKQIFEGLDAFWRPATSARKFIRFGSTSKPFTGDAQWEFVRFGLRRTTRSTPAISRLKIGSSLFSVDSRGKEEA